MFAQFFRKITKQSKKRQCQLAVEVLEDRVTPSGLNYDVHGTSLVLHADQLAGGGTVSLGTSVPGSGLIDVAYSTAADPATEIPESIPDPANGAFTTIELDAAAVAGSITVNFDDPFSSQPTAFPVGETLFPNFQGQLFPAPGISAEGILALNGVAGTFTVNVIHNTRVVQIQDNAGGDVVNIVGTGIAGDTNTNNPSQLSVVDNAAARETVYLGDVNGNMDGLHGFINLASQAESNGVNEIDVNADATGGASAGYWHIGRVRTAPTAGFDLYGFSYGHAAATADVSVAVDAVLYPQQNPPPGSQLHGPFFPGSSPHSITLNLKTGSTLEQDPVTVGGAAIFGSEFFPGTIGTVHGNGSTLESAGGETWTLTGQDAGIWMIGQLKGLPTPSFSWDGMSTLLGRGNDTLDYTALLGINSSLDALLRINPTPNLPYHVDFTTGQATDVSAGISDFAHVIPDRVSIDTPPDQTSIYDVPADNLTIAIDTSVSPMDLDLSVQVTGLPQGLQYAYDDATQQITISGTPSATGSYTVAVAAHDTYDTSDAVASASITFQWTVHAYHFNPDFPAEDIGQTALVGTRYGPFAVQVLDENNNVPDSPVTVGFMTPDDGPDSPSAVFEHTQVSEVGLGGSLHATSVTTDSQGMAAIDDLLGGLHTTHPVDSLVLTANEIPGKFDLTVSIPGAVQKFTLENLPALVASDDSASMTEDDRTVTGNVLTNDTDVNPGAAVTVNTGSVGTFSGTYGSLDLAADGSYTYMLNTGGVQHLAEGASVTDIFSYQPTDDQDARSNAATLTITINGVNDNPVAIDDTINMTENAATGNVLTNDTDADDGEVVTVAGSVGTFSGTYGSLSLAADGGYTYTLNTAGVQHLAAGQSVTDSFGYQAADEHGALSNKATLTITDTPVATTANIISSADPSNVGQLVTFTANVIRQDGLTATGSIQFQATLNGQPYPINGQSQGVTVPLIGGMATSPKISFADAGIYTVTANYKSGETNVDNSTASLMQAVKAKISTSTALHTTNAHAAYGSAVITAVVTPTAAGPATGTVTFTVTPAAGGASVSEHDPLVNGVATLQKTLTPGAYHIAAVYNASGTFLTSTAAPIAQRVQKAAPTVQVVPSATAFAVGQQVTFTVTVTGASPPAAVPTGTVSLYVDGILNQSTSLAASTAHFTLPMLAVGKHSITARYQGDGNYRRIRSATVNETILAPTTTTISPSANIATVGQTLTLSLSATVTATAGHATPTGVVTFVINGIPEGTIPVNKNGLAKLSFTFAATGTYVIEADYSGDGRFAGSAGTTTVAVNTQSQAFVVQVYRDLLHRDPTPGELGIYSTALVSGSYTHTEVAMSIAGSPEYEYAEVDAAYVHILHHHADPTALDFWSSILAAGGHVEQLDANLYGSDEYFVQRGGGTIAGFLKALFQDTGVSPTPAEIALYSSQDLRQSGSRSAVATLVLNSFQYQRNLVTGFYEEFLHTAPNASTLQLYTGKLMEGASDEMVIAMILGSNAYLQNL